MLHANPTGKKQAILSLFDKLPGDVKSIDNESRRAKTKEVQLILEQGRIEFNEEELKEINIKLVTKNYHLSKDPTGHWVLRDLKSTWVAEDPKIGVWRILARDNKHRITAKHQQLFFQLKKSIEESRAHGSTQPQLGNYRTAPEHRIKHMVTLLLDKDVLTYVNTTPSLEIPGLNKSFIEKIVSTSKYYTNPIGING